MTLLALAQRRKTGRALIAIGALLLTMAGIMLVGPGRASAAHDANPPTITEPDDENCFVSVQSVHNATHEFAKDGSDFSVQIEFAAENKTFTWTVLSPAGGSVSGVYFAGGNWYAFGPGSSGTAGPILNHGGNEQGIAQYKICGATTTTVADTTTTTVAGPDDTTTTTLADIGCPTGIPSWPGLNPAANNGNNTISGNLDGIDFEVLILHNETNNEFTFEVISPVGGSVSGEYIQQGTTYLFSGESGLVDPPHESAAINHVQICGAEGPADTTTTTTTSTTTTVPPTTTTLAGPTTTIVLAPGETTSTTVAGTTATTVLGPDSPVLPDTGPGELLAILAGGLGLVLLGSGSLVIGSDRRRVL